MGVILAPFAPIVGMLSLLGLGGFNAFTCEKSLEHYQKEMPIREARIAELEKEKLGSVSTIARLEQELRELQGVKGENAELRQENGTFRAQLDATRQQHQALITSQAKVSKDTQADLEDRGKWFDKELQKRQDLVDNTNITRWHEKTEYGKKLAEYQRFLGQARAEAGGLRTKLTAKETELNTARDTLKDVRLKLTTAGQDLDKIQQATQKALAEKDAEHREEIQGYRLGFLVLIILFAATLIALIFVLLRRRNS